MPNDGFVGFTVKVLSKYGMVTVITISDISNDREFQGLSVYSRLRLTGDQRSVLLD